MSERPLRLAIASIEYPPQPFSAGIGAYSEALATRLAARGHAVHVVSRGLERDRSERRDGVTIHFVVPPRPELPATLSPLAVAGLAARALVSEWRYRRKVAAVLTRIVDEHRLDLVESAEHMAESAAYRPRGVPLVVRLHTPLAHSELVDRTAPEFVRRFVGAMEARLARRADRVTAPTRAAADAFAATLSLPRERIEVTPNPPTFDPPPSVDDDAAAEGEPILLFVGRLSRWKGAHLLAAALPRIATVVPEVRAVFVGADNPIGGHASVRAYLRGLAGPAADRMHFTGRLGPEELRGWYRRATVVALPSLFEAFGYTCLEAMGHGKAIVGSGTGGMRDLLEEGRAGLLLEHPQPDALAALVTRLLTDPDLRRALGAAARTRATGRWHPDRVTDEIEAYYRDVRRAWRRG